MFGAAKSSCTFLTCFLDQTTLLNDLLHNLILEQKLAQTFFSSKNAISIRTIKQQKVLCYSVALVY